MKILSQIKKNLKLNQIINRNLYNIYRLSYTNTSSSSSSTQSSPSSKQSIFLNKNLKSELDSILKFTSEVYNSNENLTDQDNEQDNIDNIIFSSSSSSSNLIDNDSSFLFKEDETQGITSSNFLKRFKQYSIIEKILVLYQMIIIKSEFSVVLIANINDLDMDLFIKSSTISEEFMEKIEILIEKGLEKENYPNRKLIIRLIHHLLYISTLLPYDIDNYKYEQLLPSEVQLTIHEEILLIFVGNLINVDFLTYLFVNKSILTRIEGFLNEFTRIKHRNDESISKDTSLDTNSYTNPANQTSTQTQTKSNQILDLSQLLSSPLPQNQIQKIKESLSVDSISIYNNLFYYYLIFCRVRNDLKHKNKSLFYCIFYIIDNDFGSLIKNELLFYKLLLRFSPIFNTLIDDPLEIKKKILEFFMKVLTKKSYKNYIEMYIFLLKFLNKAKNLQFKDFIQLYSLLYTDLNGSHYIKYDVLYIIFTEFNKLDMKIVYPAYVRKSSEIDMKLSKIKLKILEERGVNALNQEKSTNPYDSPSFSIGQGNNQGEMRINESIKESLQVLIEEYNKTISEYSDYNKLKANIVNSLYTHFISFNDDSKTKIIYIISGCLKLKNLLLTSSEQEIDLRNNKISFLNRLFKETIYNTSNLLLLLSAYKDLRLIMNHEEKEIFLERFSFILKEGLSFIDKNQVTDYESKVKYYFSTMFSLNDLTIEDFNVNFILPLNCLSRKTLLSLTNTQTNDSQPSQTEIIKERYSILNFILFKLSRLDIETNLIRDISYMFVLTLIEYISLTSLNRLDFKYMFNNILCLIRIVKPVLEEKEINEDLKIHGIVINKVLINTIYEKFFELLEVNDETSTDTSKSTVFLISVSEPEGVLDIFTLLYYFNRSLLNTKFLKIYKLLYFNFLYSKFVDGRKRLLSISNSMLYMISTLNDNSFFILIHCKLLAKLFLYVKCSDVSFVKSEVNRFFAYYILNPSIIDEVNGKLNPYVKVILRMRYQVNKKKDDDLIIERRGFELKSFDFKEYSQIEGKSMSVDEDDEDYEDVRNKDDKSLGDDFFRV